VRAALDRGELPRAYLNIENVTGARSKTSYEVYLNVPEGEDPTTYDELYAGLLPMFGVVEASRSDDEHGGSGLHYVLDVTDVVRTLEAGGNWNPEQLDVSFVPVGVDPEGARVAEVDDAGEVDVGQVSLYYA
jgi:tyrosinase